MALKKLSKIQKNTHKQYKEIRKTVQDVNRKFTKEIDIIKQSKTKILEMKNSVNETKIKRFNNRIDEVEEENFRTQKQIF